MADRNFYPAPRSVLLEIRATDRCRRHTLYRWRSNPCSALSWVAGHGEVFFPCRCDLSRIPHDDRSIR